MKTHERIRQRLEEENPLWNYRGGLNWTERQVSAVVLAEETDALCGDFEAMIAGNKETTNEEH